MTNRSDHCSPRRYFVDNGGRRILIGLTAEETFEFEILDKLPASDNLGSQIASPGNETATTMREKRWLELYVKHDEAWRVWLAETYADRIQTLTLS
jgi:hypothetical protein